MGDNDRLEEDFKRFNRDIEQAAEKELDMIHTQIDALKEQASKAGEALLSPFSNEEKTS
jgi:hypothetical protein